VVDLSTIRGAQLMQHLAGRLKRALGTTSGRKMAINLLALGVICLVFTILAPRFATADNLWNVLRQISAVLIVGGAVTMLMVSGGFDLSVGAVLALSGVTAALLSQQMPVPIAFVIATLVGASVGMLNGFLVVVVGINAVIATLGTLYVSRGSALLLSNGVPVYSVPDEFKWLGTGFIGPVPVPVVTAGICLVAFTILERRTLLGRYSVAVGSNATAAQLSGVPLRQTRFVLYTLSGASAGLAGCVWASRINSGLSTVGVGFEFDVIVATLLGGTSLLGGQGTVIGMAVGALIVGVLGNGFNLLGVQSFWQTVALGTVLVLAVGLDAVLRREDLTARVRRRTRSGEPAGARSS
jgi:ribose/xylose/arabinose/galactoside ABC-type transport system permease subunit